MAGEDNHTPGSWQATLATLPTTNLLLVVGIVLFVSSGIVIALVVIFAVLNGMKPDPEFTRLMDSWLDKVLIFSGIATAQFVGKRATTHKPPTSESETNTGEPANKLTAGAPASTVQQPWLTAGESERDVTE